MKRISLEYRPVKIEEYQKLRKTTTWDMLSDEQVKIALNNDLFTVCAMDSEKLVGIGRLIGDGGIYFYIQDLMVLPEYKGIGIGKLIMNKLMRYVNENCQKGSFIGLMAARGLKEYYEYFGFEARNPESPGMFKII